MLSEEALALLRVNSGHENASAKVEIQCTHENQQREESSLLLCIKDRRYQALSRHTETHCPRIERQIQSHTETPQKGKQGEQWAGCKEQSYGCPPEDMLNHRAAFHITVWPISTSQINHKRTQYTKSLNCSVTLLILRDSLFIWFDQRKMGGWNAEYVTRYIFLAFCTFKCITLLPSKWKQIKRQWHIKFH